MLTGGLPEDVDGLAHSRQGPEGGPRNPRRDPGPTGTILGLPRLSKWPFGHLASVTLRNPALPAQPPVLPRHVTVPLTPQLSQPQPAGGPSLPICCGSPVQLAIRSGRGLEPQLVLVRLAPPLGGC